ncbi:MAG: NAD(P)/FAD-dependent oxidoreductase [Oscillospiraceae bacterium]|nr:NAD(P)/FAD-dependent oxidoreductase [Oscillospiraceae bacterium]
MNDKKYDFLVVGGGASGLYAAVTAAKNGLRTLVLERNERIGKKLLITGKGRCNVTNNCTHSELIAAVAKNPRFLYGAFSRLTPADVMTFFESFGVTLKTERGKRVFPQSDKASDVVKAFDLALKKYGADVILSRRVTELMLQDGHMCGVKCDDDEYFADNVLIATGGKSYPLTGSTGDGYILAESSGHNITELCGSLVPIEIAQKDCSDMMGLTLKNVTLTLKNKASGKVVFSDMGEMLFTHFGMSGPLVLSASSHINNNDIKNYEIIIDLKPGLNVQQLDARLLRDFSNSLNKNFENSLGSLLPRKMISTIVKRSGIDREQKVNSITKQQRQRLCELLKELRFDVSGLRPIEEAIITSGGVNVREISPKTMESKLVKGLYFAGEILDVDAYTGGFNLQIAFSTGYACACDVIEKIRGGAI